MRIWSKWTAVLLLILWPGLMCSAQRAVFFAQNKVAVSSGGTVTYDNTCMAYQGTNYGCTLTVAASGSTIFVGAMAYNWGSETATITDTGSYAASNVLQGFPVYWTSPFTGGMVYYQWVFTNAGVGAHIFAITWSGNGGYYDNIVAVSLHGASLTSPIDANTPSTGSGTAACTGTVTTSKSNEFLLAMGVTGTDSALTAATTPQIMTLVGGTANTYGGDAEYGTAVTAGANYTTFPLTASEGWACGLIAVH